MPEKKRIAIDAKNWALFDPSIAWPALVNASPFAIIALNPEGQVLFWNAAAERIFGWTDDEVLGRPLPTIPLGREHEFRMLLESQMHWIPQQGKDVVCCRKDGAPIHMTLWTAPLQDADANIRGKLSILADTSESHRAQLERAQLLNSERDAREYARSMDRFRELLEAAPDAIIETDAQGKIVLLTRRSRNQTGLAMISEWGKNS